MYFNLEIPSQPAAYEQIRLDESGIHGRISVYTGQQGDFVVALIPSLNVSGYGRSEADAHESLSENLETLLYDLLALPETQRYDEFAKLGWLNNDLLTTQIFPQKLDEVDILRNFDNPEQVKKSTLLAA
jgi:hypothetical protein